MKYLSLIIIILMVFIGFLITNYYDTQTQNHALQTKIENLQRDNTVQNLTIQAYEQTPKEIEKEIVYIPEDKWQIFEATAYTSKDEGCNNISAIGMNIEKWSKYFNFAAVDKNVIPLGSVLLVQIDNEQLPFLAVDVGGAIKGNKLDLYFVNDLEAAFEFGRQDVLVKRIGD